MNVERHLVLQDLAVSPSAEWSPHCNGWMMVRVAAGTGYWLQHGMTHRQLGPGDGFLVIRNVTGIIRASQLDSLKIQLFVIQPQYLNGLLTVMEWQRLEVAPDNPLPAILFFTADEPTGQKFTRLADQANNDRLPIRCALLQLWANAVAGMLPLPASPSLSGNRLRDHFRELIGQMTEAELSERSLADLSQQLHCSERHFSRLFREEFGVPFRTRQSELRLQRARQRLADPHASVLSVAHETGYRYLAPFNAVFKKRFGITPIEWHRRHVSENP